MTIREFLFLKRHDIILNTFHKIEPEFSMWRVIGKAHFDKITGDLQIKLKGVDAPDMTPVITYNDLEHYIMTPGLQRQFNGYYNIEQPSMSPAQTSS